MISLCDGWQFRWKWSEDFMSGAAEGEHVRLPHTVREVPLHYAAPEDYETVCAYRRTLSIPAEYEGKRLFLQFDGAAHIAEVFVNGVKCAEHRCGYTAFRAEITELVKYGADNMLSVRLDCTENPAIPPFGFVIDYLTYGGLYRRGCVRFHANSKPRARRDHDKRRRRAREGAHTRRDALSCRGRERGGGDRA